MAADTISGYFQALLDGIEFKQTAYALDRDSRKAALARFMKQASGGHLVQAEEECGCRVASAVATSSRKAEVDP